MFKLQNTHTESGTLHVMFKVINSFLGWNGQLNGINKVSVLQGKKKRNKVSVLKHIKGDILTILSSFYSLKQHFFFGRLMAFHEIKSTAAVQTKWIRGTDSPIKSDIVG